MFPSDLEILSEIEFDPLRHQVLLVGSVADGWGNATSDIDIVVVSPGENRQAANSSYNVNLERWLDVRRMSALDVEQLRKAVELNVSLPDEWGSHYVASLDQLDTYHRIARARVLSAPIAIGETTRLCVDSLIREACLTHLIIARARWEDSAGAAIDGDLEQAAYVAEIGIWHLVDALAALAGMTNPGSKWRLKKLAGIAEETGWISSLAERLTDNRRAWSSSADLLGWLGSGIELLTARLHHINLHEPSHIHARPERLEYDRRGLRRIVAGGGMEYVTLRQA